MGTSTLKILYVDDSSVVRGMVESFLLELGYLNIVRLINFLFFIILNLLF